MSETVSSEIAPLPAKDHPLFYVLRQQQGKNAKKLAVLCHGVQVKGGNACLGAGDLFRIPNGSLTIFFYIPEGVKMFIANPTSQMGNAMKCFPLTRLKNHELDENFEQIQGDGKSVPNYYLQKGVSNEGLDENVRLCTYTDVRKAMKGGDFDVLLVRSRFITKSRITFYDVVNYAASYSYEQIHCFFCREPPEGSKEQTAPKVKNGVQHH